MKSQVSKGVKALAGVPSIPVVNYGPSQNFGNDNARQNNFDEYNEDDAWGDVSKAKSVIKRDVPPQMSFNFEFNDY